MCNSIDTEGQRLNAKLTLINLHRPGARGNVEGRQQMEMVTKAHELCAAVKTIKIYKGGNPVGEGRRRGGSQHQRHRFVLQSGI